MTKGAPPFNRKNALDQLISHMFSDHPEELEEMYLMLIDAT